MNSSDAAVQKKVLPNGLTVLVKEMHHAPLATFWVWYRVGSKNEKPGITGASHWVEHMMFKESPNFPPGEVDRLVSREGGRFNAFTWIDFTAYFETMPSDQIDLALRIESDRMNNAIMTEETIESERTVILSERHMYENSPGFLLHEEVSAAAFRVHPYHHGTIGDEADLLTMSREDLYGHYKRHYSPSNAIAIAVGDFEAEAMLARIEELFGDIPPGESIDPVTRIEPKQRGERRVIVNGPGQTRYLSYAFRAPSASDEDYYPLLLLNAAFAGGGSLGFFGGDSSNKTSRLYRALVGGGLAVGVSGGAAPTSDPHLYEISVVVNSGKTLEEVESALVVEIDRLESEPIQEAELAKAMKRARAQFVMAGESVTGQAEMLGVAETIAGDYSWYEQAIEELARVTLEDVERVRRQVLRRSNLTVGLYEPNGS